MYGPRIEGLAVTLRPPVEAEAETMIGWFQDPEVIRYLDRRFPPSLQSQREWLLRMADSRDDLFWALEHDGRLIGGTGIHGIDWANQNGTTGIVVGDRLVWGRGIATEVMRLRARYAFRELNLRKLKSRFIDGNQGSARAQLATGYRQSGRLRQETFREGRWHDVITTELLRDDWEASQAGRASDS